MDNNLFEILGSGVYFSVIPLRLGYFSHYQMALFFPSGPMALVVVHDLSCIYYKLIKIPESI